MAITLLICRHILTTIREYRQNYADARASLFMDPEKLARLTKKAPSRSNQSPIESLFEGLFPDYVCFIDESGKSIKSKLSRSPVPFKLFHHDLSTSFEKIRAILFKPLKI